MSRRHEAYFSPAISGSSLEDTRAAAYSSVISGASTESPAVMSKRIGPYTRLPEAHICRETPGCGPDPVAQLAVLIEEPHRTYEQGGCLHPALRRAGHRCAVDRHTDERKIFVASTRDNAIWQLPLAKTAEISTLPSGVGPDGIAIDEHGGLVVAHPGLGPETGSILRARVPNPGRLLYSHM